MVFSSMHPDKCTQLCNNHITPKRTPSVVSSFLPSLVPGNHWPILPFSECCINGIIQCVTFDNRQLLLSIMLLKFIYVVSVPWVFSFFLSFLFIYFLSSILLYGYTTVCLSIHPLRVISDFGNFQPSFYEHEHTGLCVDVFSFL